MIAPPRAAVVQPAAAHERVAQRPGDQDDAGAGARQRAADDRDLPLESVQLTGAVAAVDAQQLPAEERSHSK
ncbi:MAG: hypothetical protein ACR2NR_23250, partial [Solirubrobacteraceae bacterium]